MLRALAVLSLAALVVAQDDRPRPAPAILRDFDRVSMPGSSGGNDPESVRRFHRAIEDGSRRKAALALELFSAHPDHERVPAVMDIRWATFNNVLHDHPAVIVETTMLLEGEGLREDLRKAALQARARAMTLSPQSTNKERLDAVRELIAADAENERTGIALLDVVQGHLADPDEMKALLDVAVQCWPESAYVGRPAKRWLATLERVGRAFAGELPEELRPRFDAEVGARSPFTVVQVWSGWVTGDGAKRELATLAGLRRDHGDGVRLIGFLAGDVEARLPDVRKAGADWPQIGVGGSSGRSFLGVARTPCYFVLDRDRKIVGIVGTAEAAALRIRQLRE